MSRILKPLAVVAAIVFISTTNAQEVLLRSVMKENRLSTTEAAAAILIGEALGVKMDWLMHAQAHHSQPFIILGPAIVISKQTGKHLDFVMKNRPKGKGKGWGNVAKQMGMHPGDFNKMRVQGVSFESLVWMNMLSKKYKFKPSEFKKLQKDGFKDAHIVLAVVRTEGKPDALRETIALMKANRPKFAGAGGGNSKGRGKGKGGGL